MIITGDTGKAHEYGKSSINGGYHLFVVMSNSFECHQTYKQPEELKFWLSHTKNGSITIMNKHTSLLLIADLY